MEEKRPGSRLATDQEIVGLVQHLMGKIADLETRVVRLETPPQPVYVGGHFIGGAYPCVGPIAPPPIKDY